MVTSIGTHRSVAAKSEVAPPAIEGTTRNQVEIWPLRGVIGLKIPRPQGRPGSNPGSGTNGPIIPCNWSGKTAWLTQIVLPRSGPTRLRGVTSEPRRPKWDQGLSVTSAI